RTRDRAPRSSRVRPPRTGRCASRPAASRSSSTREPSPGCRSRATPRPPTGPAPGTRPSARRTRMREHRGVIAGLLGLLLVLSGCASIPSNGETGVISVEDQAQRVQSEVEPEGPVEGADPNTIVRGFLAAGAGHADDFAVARSFLTEDFAKEWEPEASVVIMPGGADFDTITSEVSSDQQSIS